MLRAKWIGQQIKDWKCIRWLQFLDVRLQMAGVYAMQARFFSNQPRLVERFTKRHRNQIDIFNYHKPWYLRKRHYSL